MKIRANGDIVTSPYLPLVVGNIRNHSIEEYWNGGLYELWKDKFTVVSIIVTIVCILVSIIFFFLVPNKISIQWSAAEPSNIVSKTYIFIMPIISVLTLSIGKKIFRFVVYKYFQRENEKFISYLNMYFNIVFLTCELYVIAYVYGVRLTISSIILAEIVIGAAVGIKILKRR